MNDDVALLWFGWRHLSDSFDKRQHLVRILWYAMIGPSEVMKLGDSMVSAFLFPFLHVSEEIEKGKKHRRRHLKRWLQNKV